MIRRSARRVPAVLAAVVLLAVAASVAVACAQLLLGQQSWIPFSALAATAAGLTAGAPAVLAAAGAAALVGLVLLGAALLPGAPRVLPVTVQGDAGAPLRVGATRRSLHSSLDAAVGGVGGVERSAVRVRGRRVTARVTTALPDSTAVAEEVRRAVQAQLDDLDLARPPRTTVRATSERSPR